jgi:hypothetical protein
LPQCIGPGKVDYRSPDPGPGFEDAPACPCLNDASGRGPGFGETQFTPILKTLLKNAYKGYISVEVFEFDPDPQTIASRSLGYLKRIMETLSEAG